MAFARFMLAAFLVLALAGCSPRARGVLCPNGCASPIGGKAITDMLVVTTRDSKNAERGEMFTGDRGDKLSFADIAVSIPPAHQTGRVEWPTTPPGDPATDFVATRAEELDKDAAIKRFHARIAKASHRQVLIFVHGYNNSFEEAVFRFAQLVHDSRVKAEPVLFTWPSHAKLSGYGYDSDSATYSRDDLEKGLRYLNADKAVGEISIIAHSMGNWLTLEALRQMAIRDGRIPSKIKHVVLAAPDVDYDVFRRQIEQIHSRPNLFHLIVARDDRALAASRCLHDKTARLGAIDPNDERYKSELARNYIHPFDSSGLATDEKTRHGRVYSSPLIVQQIGGLVENGHALQEERPGLGRGVGNVATSAGSALGSFAGAVAAAPLTIVDPDSGGASWRPDDLFTQLCMVSDALGDATQGAAR